jgi:hypothetical protein
LRTHFGGKNFTISFAKRHLERFRKTCKKEYFGLKGGKSIIGLFSGIGDGVSQRISYFFNKDIQTRAGLSSMKR